MISRDSYVNACWLCTQSTHDVSTLVLAGLQAHVGIGPLVAGLATIDHLQHGDRYSIYAL